MKQSVYDQTIKTIRTTLPEAKRDNFDARFGAVEKSPLLALTLGVLLGFFGADRYYIGAWALGALKLVSLGGLGIWYVVDWFLIMPATRKRNLALAIDMRGRASSGG